MLPAFWTKDLQERRPSPCAAAPHASSSCPSTLLTERTQAPRPARRQSSRGYRQREVPATVRPQPAMLHSLRSHSSFSCQSHLYFIFKKQANYSSLTEHARKRHLLNSISFKWLHLVLYSICKLFHCYLKDIEYFDLFGKLARLTSVENKLPPEQNKGITPQKYVSAGLQQRFTEREYSWHLRSVVAVFIASYQVHCLLCWIDLLIQYLGSSTTVSERETGSYAGEESFYFLSQKIWCLIAEYFTSWLRSPFSEMWDWFSGQGLSCGWARCGTSRRWWGTSSSAGSRGPAAVWWAWCGAWHFSLSSHSAWKQSPGKLRRSRTQSDCVEPVPSHHLDVRLCGPHHLCICTQNRLISSTEFN